MVSRSGTVHLTPEILCLSRGRGAESSEFPGPLLSQVRSAYTAGRPSPVWNIHSAPMPDNRRVYAGLRAQGKVPWGSRSAGWTTGASCGIHIQHLGHFGRFYDSVVVGAGEAVLTDSITNSRYHNRI